MSKTIPVTLRNGITMDVPAQFFEFWAQAVGDEYVASDAFNENFMIAYKTGFEDGQNEPKTTDA